jgi:hypothetical protein
LLPCTSSGLPIFKKGDRRDPKNYIGINILNACYKIWAATLKSLIWNCRVTNKNLTETQNRFRKGRSCTDSAFFLKLLIEKRREYNLETHLLFIDHKKRLIMYKYLYSKIQKYSRYVVKGKNGRTQNKISIKFNSSLSQLPEINSGVCQGTYTKNPTF